ncbi:MAG: radical SAM protein [Nanoarchaeota archaeon]
MNNNITLICPTNAYGSSATSGIYYPMGILLVGSVVKKRMNCEMNLVDGEGKSVSDLEKAIIGTKILGLSANTDNYPYCVQLANFSKNIGIQKIVIGGPHSTARARQILQNQPAIDIAVKYDGEEAFSQILQGRELSSIPNLVWRDGNTIRENAVILPRDPPRLTSMDYSLLDLSLYWEIHQRAFPAMSKKFIEGFTHYGCRWREIGLKVAAKEGRDGGGCEFCDIPYLTNVYQDPEKFWKDLREINREWGIESFKDYGDCFTGNSAKVQAFLEARPKDLEHITFSCYGRSPEIKEHMADMLQQLNVKYVYIGLDSGSNSMLKSMHEGYTIDQNKKAIDLLSKREIYITGSLIVGAEGESEETIAETESFAKEIVTNPYVSQISCSVLTPFPGAPVGRKLIKRFPHLEEKDLWDSNALTRLWAENFCKVSYEYLVSKADQINSLKIAFRKRYFGYTKSP